jgi:hypothetical protein
VENFTVPRAIGQDPTIYDDLLSAAKELVGQGVRAVTGDCGFMGIHQKKMASELNVPVFLSSLIQINFITPLIGKDKKIGIVTADSRSLGKELLKAVGVNTMDNLVIAGMEDQPQFKKDILEVSGSLDSGKIEQEVVAVSRDMLSLNPDVRLILLECSMLPPYSYAVQEVTNLPVFDFITMINYVKSAVVQQRYFGFM